MVHGNDDVGDDGDDDEDDDGDDDHPLRPSIASASIHHYQHQPNKDRFRSYMRC